MRYIRALTVLVFIVTISIFNWRCSEDNTVNSYKSKSITDPQFDCPFGQSSQVFIYSKIPNCANCSATNLSTGTKIIFSTNYNGTGIIQCLEPGTWLICVSCGPSGSVFVTVDGFTTYYVDLTSSRC
jgi:hypothetical protein